MRSAEATSRPKALGDAHALTSLPAADARGGARASRVARSIGRDARAERRDGRARVVERRRRRHARDTDASARRGRTRRARTRHSAASVANRRGGARARARRSLRFARERREAAHRRGWRRACSVARAYLDAQIAIHAQVLATVKRTSIPAAHHAELRTHLEALATTVAEHLREAKELRAQL